MGTKKRKTSSVFLFQYNFITAAAYHPPLAGRADDLNQPPSLGSLIHDNLFTPFQCFRITIFQVSVTRDFHEFIIKFSHNNSSFSYDICLHYNGIAHKDTIGICDTGIKIVYRFRNDSCFLNEKKRIQDIRRPYPHPWPVPPTGADGS